MSKPPSTQKSGKTDTIKNLRRNERKWTKPLMDAGWTAWPNILLKKQRELGLDSINLNILLQLSKHWWEADNLPHPSKQSIADAIDLDPSTVRKRIAAMEKAGLIKRRQRRLPHGGSRTNEYIFTGLINKARPYAERELQDIEERKTRARTRGRGLRVVKGSE